MFMGLEYVARNAKLYVIWYNKEIDMYKDLINFIYYLARYSDIGIYFAKSR